MKIRHIQVIGDIAKPLPDHKASQATHQLNLTNEKYDTYVNDTYFKVVEGAPVAKTQEEIDAQIAESQKRNAIKEAENLYKELKCDRIINHNGIEYDLKDSFEFDFQRKKGGDVRVKVKDGKTKVMTKQDTDDLETALFTYLNDLATDFDADMDLIEAGDYTLPNLKAR
jgi:predicted RNA-binding protein Jag